MNGIERIQKALDTERQGREDEGPRAEIKEIFAKDGDQIFATSAATGNNDDTLFSEYRLYTFENGRYFTNVLDDERVDTSNIPPNKDGTARGSGRKFAFWAYIHHILHTTKTSSDMVEVAGAGGRKLFKEEVNDYRILSFSFGRGSANWNQVFDIYEDWDSLDKGIIKIKRSGVGLDTTYAISTTLKTEEIPENRVPEIATLTPIMDYMFGRHGRGVTIQETTNDGLF